MSAAEQQQAGGRPTPRRQQQPGRLPQPPRRREEFANSSRLAGVGAKIAARSGAPSPESPTRSPKKTLKSSATSGRGNVSARGARTSDGSVSPRPSARLEEEAEDPAPRDIVQDVTEDLSSKSTKAMERPPDKYVDALELARGGEALLSRLGDLHSANSDLRRQLEMQVKEVSTLQEAGVSQQQLLRQFEQQASQMKQAEAATIETRVRGEIADHEVRLRVELDEEREQASAEKEEFMTRLHHMDGELRHIEGERDEARERVRQLEERLGGGVSGNAPDTQVERTKGLEMELGLLKARFARETEAKKAAERASAESRAQQRDAKVQVDKQMEQVRQLQKSLAEQTELASFRQEICNDLQLRLKDQQSESDRMIRREKGKFEAVSRLEGILPRHLLLQALT